MSKTQVRWTLGFETPLCEPEPYYEISGSADFVLGFTAEVLAEGWTLTTAKYE